MPAAQTQVRVVVDDLGDQLDQVRIFEGVQLVASL